jgi:CheY-like chemotaxis protein
MGGTIWVESRGCIGGNPNPLFQNTATEHNSNQKIANQNSSNYQVKATSFHFTIAVSISEKPQLVERFEPLSTKNLQVAEKFPLNILVVEDNLMNQRLASLIVKKFGYSVDIANNGLEAIQSVQEHIYDIVLMDVQMPEMDGLTATKWIRQNLKYQPHIVALTASSSLSDRTTCFSAGMNDYIMKPIDFQEIKRVIFQVVSHLNPEANN